MDAGGYTLGVTFFILLLLYRPPASNNKVVTEICPHIFFLPNIQKNIHKFNTYPRDNNNNIPL